jgi:hypothetical protein
MSEASSDEPDIFEIIHSTRSNRRLRPLGRSRPVRHASAQNVV